MTASTGRSYEDLRSKIAELNPAGEDERRSLVWCNEAQSLAASRGVRGELEIFLLGPPLDAASETVREILDHSTWKREDGSTITASRLVLPPTDPFDAITTFLCTELLRNGAGANPQAGLRATEPVIEAVLQRIRLQEDSVIGLLGELLVLLHLLRGAHLDVEQILGGWHGPSRSARDLQIAGVGVEVKTTRAGRSRHHIQGLRQVELGHAVGGVHETALLLVSIGLERADAGRGHTLPGVVDAILDEITSRASSPHDHLIVDFIDRLADYGLGAGDGYRHGEMRARAFLAQGWQVAFCRTYDMTDPAMRVLRTEDIAPRSMVDPTTVTFEVELPDRVTGDANPAVGLQQMASTIARAVG